MLYLEIPNAQGLRKLHKEFPQREGNKAMEQLEDAYTDYRISEEGSSKKQVEDNAVALLEVFGATRGKEIVRRIYAAIDGTIADVIGKGLNG
jgi:hypothetical protein